MSSSMDNFEATGKLSLIENQQPPSSLSSNLKRNKILIKAFFSLIILLAIITGAMIIDLVRKYNKSQEKIKLEREAELPRVYCSMTRFPSPCLNSILFLDNHNPDNIFHAYLQVATKQVTNLTSLTRALILRSTVVTESRNESTPFKCSSLIDDSLNQLNRSLTASSGWSLVRLRVDSGETEGLFGEKIHYMEPLVNQAMNDLLRCFEILDTDRLTAVIELRNGVHDGIVHVSNIYDLLRSGDRIVDEIGYLNRYPNPIPEDHSDLLSTIIIFAPQYFLLIFLLCLLFRIY